MLTRLFMTALLLMTTKALAFTELNSIYDLNFANLANDTLVVFDLDNTLIRPTTYLGSVEWAEYRRDQLIKEGLNKEEAAIKQHELFNQVQPFIKIQTVEKLDYIIQGSLSRLNVIGLTARNPMARLVTLKQVREAGITFFDSNLIEDGVAFADGKDKGILLKQIVANLPFQPSKVIFIDDKQYNVEAVDRIQSEVSYKIESYRYSAADNLVKNLDRDLADLEYSFLKNTLEFSAITKTQASSSVTLAEKRFLIETAGALVNSLDCAINIPAMDIYKVHCTATIAIRDDDVAMEKDYEFILNKNSQVFFFKDWRH